jgi:hypothetical protein
MLNGAGAITHLWGSDMFGAKQVKVVGRIVDQAANELLADKPTMKKENASRDAGQEPINDKFREAAKDHIDLTRRESDGPNKFDVVNDEKKPDSAFGQAQGLMSLFRTKLQRSITVEAPSIPMQSVVIDDPFPDVVTHYDVASGKMISVPVVSNDEIHERRERQRQSAQEQMLRLKAQDGVSALDVAQFEKISTSGDTYVVVALAAFFLLVAAAFWYGEGDLVVATGKLNKKMGLSEGLEPVEKKEGLIITIDEVDDDPCEDSGRKPEPWEMDYRFPALRKDRDAKGECTELPGDCKHCGIPGKPEGFKTVEQFSIAIEEQKKKFAEQELALEVKTKKNISELEAKYAGQREHDLKKMEEKIAQLGNQLAEMHQKSGDKILAMKASHEEHVHQMETQMIALEKTLSDRQERLEALEAERLCKQLDNELKAKIPQGPIGSGRERRATSW